jgi:hypothetical protein
MSRLVRSGLSFYMDPYTIKYPHGYLKIINLPSSATDAEDTASNPATQDLRSK